jgi:hypothetical protein
MTSHITTLGVSPFKIGLTSALLGDFQALALRPGMARVSPISIQVPSQMPVHY